MRKRIVFHLKWAAAILVAALYGKARWHTAFLALLGILRDRGRTVSRRKYEARIRACKSCPVFYAPLQTCGSPLNKDKELRESGCFCYQPVAARFAAKRCWLDEDLGADAAPYGWEANRCA